MTASHPGPKAVWGVIICMGLMLLCNVEAYGQEPSVPDTVSSLEEVVVSTRRSPVGFSDDGNVDINLSRLSGLGGMFGETDVVNMLKKLPGVTSLSDMGSGLSVDGADFSQTSFEIDGVPVYFPYRLGGVFSAFNTWHFQRVSFERSPFSGASPARLGSRVGFHAYVKPAAETFTGRGSVGLLSSSLALRVFPSEKISLSGAARISYINQIYGKMLKVNDSRIATDFCDLNLTLIWRPDPGNTVTANGFMSRDVAEYGSSSYNGDFDIRWFNRQVSLAWRHTGRVDMSHRIYFTDFRNALRVGLMDVRMRAPSALENAGVSGEFVFPAIKGMADLVAGYSFNYYMLTPLWCESSGFGQDMEPVRNVQDCYDGKIFGDAGFQVDENLRLGFSVSGYIWKNGSYHRADASPRLSLKLRFGSWSLAASGGVNHQYLHRIGFSEIGLASDFWFGASESSGPQLSAGGGVELSHRLPFGLTAAVSVYCRRVCGQPEYDGMIFDLIDREYDSMSHILDSDGYNAGAAISIRRESGRLTGMTSYGYGVARRKYSGSDSWHYGATDPGHSLTISAEYAIDPRWTVGADFMLNSGRRYTPVEQLYMIGGNIISVYGGRNSAQLPLYHRLDLSAVFKIPPCGRNGRIRQSLSLGLLNAYGHRNVDARYFFIDSETGEYRQRDQSSLFRFLPSVSYILSF